MSKSEIEFTLQALRGENVRVDGRALTAYRRLGIRFNAVHGEVEVNFGPTRAMAVCSGEIITPPPERPNEGRISFNVEFGPIASPGFEPGRASVQAVAVSNLIERLLRGSRAIDAEALCIIGGQKVWSIRVDVRALDDDGNLGDACAIAALCALLHFRKAEVEVAGDTMKAYTLEERVPVPLSIHHLPVPVTFALFLSTGKDAQPTWILDPNRLEEAAMGGALCIAVNQHGELCGLHKPGGMPVDFAVIQHCTELAVARAREIVNRIQAELEADLTKRKAARRNVHQHYEKSELLTVEMAPDTATAPVLASAPEAYSKVADTTAEPAAVLIDDGIDLEAEIAAVTAEAAELEEQLAILSAEEKPVPAADTMLPITPSAEAGLGSAAVVQRGKKKRRKVGNT